MWAVLGAQEQTRANILSPGTGFDSQRQLLANLEDAVNSLVDPLGSIDRFQKALQYAETSLNYVVGAVLYLMPSVMQLHSWNVVGWNNKLLIAPSDTTIGLNPWISPLDPASSGSGGDPSFQGKVAPPAGAASRGPVADDAALARQKQQPVSSKDSNKLPAGPAERVKEAAESKSRRRPTMKKKRRLSWPEWGSG